jgi:hypothetical protein
MRNETLRVVNPAYLPSMSYGLPSWANSMGMKYKAFIITRVVDDKKLLIRNVYILIYFIASEFIWRLLSFGLVNLEKF